MSFDPNDPDTKAALAAAVKTAVTDATTGLDAKNKELLDEVKAAKAELRKHKDIDPADLAKLEAEAERLAKELADANKAAKDATAAAEKAAKALEAETGFTAKLLVQDGLKSALLANGVKDEDFIDTLSAKMASAALVVTEGDARVAKIGDKTLSDYVKEWAGTDVGKKFVAAPNNSGGGAGGGKGGDGGTVNPFAAETRNMTEQGRLYREDPAKAIQLAKEAGVDIAA